MLSKLPKKTFVVNSRNFFVKMNDLLKPPEIVKNVQTLDRAKFDKPVKLPCITLPKDVKVSYVLATLKKYLLKINRYKPIVNDNDTGDSRIVLNPVLIDSFDSLTVDERRMLSDKGVTDDNFTIIDKVLTYDNYTVEDVLRAVLPTDKEGVASYTKVGHIIHLNLREHLFPFKSLIGEVMLDKIAGCRTVVNKIDMIDSTYRNFQMEVLAGESDFNVTLKENKCQFQFDFSKVYWNSRLCTEHERIVDMIDSGDVLFDVFAGVGPFSIPVGKKGCIVYANDLNPESYRWLLHNKKINKVGDNLSTFNKDGADFIKSDVKTHLLKHARSSSCHIVMNLPALAHSFLRDLHNLYTSDSFDGVTLKPITLYVYCFAKGEDYLKITKELIARSFSIDVSGKIIDVFKVRTVSSLKEMMRVTINIDKDILCYVKRRAEEATGEKIKKCKASDGERREQVKGEKAADEQGF